MTVKVRGDDGKSARDDGKKCAGMTVKVRGDDGKKNGKIAIDDTP